MPFMIFEKFVVERDVYIQSREAYYRFVVHMGYLTEKMLEMKLKSGTDQSNDSGILKNSIVNALTKST